MLDPKAHGRQGSSVKTWLAPASLWSLPVSSHVLGKTTVGRSVSRWGHRGV